MAKKLVSELSGAELDYWVAMADRVSIVIMADKILYSHYPGMLSSWSPSTNPAQGWPIIERFKINLNWVDGNQCEAVIDKYKVNNWVLKGETGLIAAMRCRVASVYGETVGDDE